MKKLCLVTLPVWLAFAGSLHAQPSPGVIYDLGTQFDTNANPSIGGWSYDQGLAFGGGTVSQTIDTNWNSPDFGPGQPGYDGILPGTFAGWAQRIDTGNIGSEPGGPFDDPVGSIIGYRNSAVLTIPNTDPGGTANIRGGIWNLRHFSRSGTWSIWQNDTNEITSGSVDDTSGTSAAPYGFENGSDGAAGLSNIVYHPGDTFRFNCDEDDYIGVKFSITTFTDPYITNQPQAVATYETGGQTVPFGGSASLTVGAGGITPVSYQWQLNGTNIVGATNWTLTVTNMSVAKSGNYTVVVSDTAGQITSRPALLQTSGSIAISHQPSDETVNSGQTATFSVTASGTGTLTYQWQRNGVNLVESTNYVGTTSATLTIPNATTNEAGSYSVVVGNGTSAAASQSATLNVRPPIPFFPGYPHDLQAQFSNNGNPTADGWTYSALLVTYGSGPISSTIDPNWNQPDFGPGQPGYDGTQPGPYAGWAKRIDTGNIDHEPGGGAGGMDDPVGTVIGYQNSVVWIVPSTDPGGVAYVAGGIWNIRHFGRAGYWTIYHNDQGTAQGEITGGPFGDTAGTSAGSYSFENGTGGPSALQGIPYAPGDTFRFNCDEGDYFGVKFTIYTVSDPGIAQNATNHTVALEPTDQTVVTGSTVTNTVVATGTAPFTYQWQMNGVNLTGATNATLILSNVQTNQSGSYAVVISNSKGSITSDPGFLTVLPPLYFITQPLTQTANSGETVTFSALAGGVAPITYQWQFNGANIAGVTNSTLILAGVTTNSMGNYSVVAGNGLGQHLTSAVATLTVLPPIPVFAGTPHDLGVQFDTSTNPTPLGWEYSTEVIQYGGGPISATIDPNWNSPDFGSGQPGYDGTQPGPYAGWAKRIDNGMINAPDGSGDTPVGTIIGYDNSVVWTVPSTDPGGVANIAGGIWNLRHFGRSGDWGILHNGSLLSQGSINDGSGSSAGPYSFANGNGGDSALTKISYSPGDTFQFDCDEGDFYGVEFTIYTVSDPGVAQNPTNHLMAEEPASETVVAGSTVTNSVIASGTAPFTYQWQFNGLSLAGATNATLVLSNVQTNQSGTYTVIISNSKGSIASDPAVLTVVVSRPTIGVTLSSGNFVLTWSGGGILQTATNVAGPYTDIVGSGNPWTIAPSGAQRFYRVKQ